MAATMKVNSEATSPTATGPTLINQGFPVQGNGGIIPSLGREKQATQTEAAIMEIF
jgi:hypothetical protein